MTGEFDNLLGFKNGDGGVERSENDLFHIM